MKKILFTLLALFWAAQLHAGVITVAADDSIRGFTINGQDFLGALSGRDNWRTVSTLEYDFLPGTSYELVWNLADVYHSAMGFIGSVDTGDGQVYNSRIGNEGWSFSASSNTALYDTQNGLGPWGRTVAAAFPDAYWVGYTRSSEFARGDIMTATLRFSTAPVPLPAAAWMFGAGLLALAGMRRKMA